jgi:nicotinate dehydrogenase subunit B
VSVDHAWSAQDCGPAINNGRHEAAGRGLPDAGCQPLVDRGAEVERERRHEQRLGDLSGDPVHRDASEVRLSSTARTDQPAVGAGEVLVTNVPAAIANGIFDATGKRMRQLPFTPARVRTALTV